MTIIIIIIIIIITILIYSMFFAADASISGYVIPITVVTSVAVMLILVVIIICIKCPHFCVVDVMTYRQERSRLQRHIKQNQGKSLDLTHYLQRRQLELGRQQKSMNTVALYVAVSEEMQAAR